MRAPSPFDVLSISTRVSAGLGLAGLLVLTACADPPEAPPDVVLIEMSAVRADHVAHLGYALPTSRSLDAFRERAALFAGARSVSSGSAAATASLLTGLSPAQLRVSSAAPLLEPSPTTLAEQLRNAGYATLGISHHPHVARETGFARGFDEFTSVPGEPEDHPDGTVMVDWLREWIALDPPRPFFLYLLPMDAHPPYRVPLDQRNALLGRPPSDAMPHGGALMRAARNPLRRRAREAIGERELRSLSEQYDTALRYAFDRVAATLAILQQAGRLDGALVVITSNHGQELFEHGGFDHGRTLYEEVLRVPLYVKPPGRMQPSRFDLPVSTLDVMPTVLDLLGLPAVPGDGRSLAPLLRGEREDLPPRDFVHAVQPEGPFTLLRALVRGRHKLIQGPGRAELYDLVLDPAEQQDLSEGNLEMVRELRRALGDATPEMPELPATPGSGAGSGPGPGG